jgi:hypothetical protein
MLLPMDLEAAVRSSGRHDVAPGEPGAACDPDAGADAAVRPVSGPVADASRL